MKKIGILLVILVFPSLFYIFLSSARHHSKSLPIYGIKEPIFKNGVETKDTLYHTIPKFLLTNQYGEIIDQSVMDDKIVIADYFFTTCKSICPKMSGELSIIQEKLKTYDDVVILSYTVNPKFDSVPVLFNYAKKHFAIKGKWHFLTGNKKEIYDLARHGYLINALDGDGGDDDFIHEDKFVLIDKQKRIRGFFKGTDPAESLRLVNEVKLLLANEQKPKKKNS